MKRTIGKILSDRNFSGNPEERVNSTGIMPVHNGYLEPVNGEGRHWGLRQSFLEMRAWGFHDQI